MRRSVVCALLLLLCAGCHRSRNEAPLFVVVVPSQDNHFFKA
ncbi:MAG: hypothetical protein ACLGXA_14530 [Acidobacteriota bacterium]